MSDLDPALIEAVAKGMYESRPHKWLMTQEVVTWEIVGERTQYEFRADAEAAIRAIDTYRAAAVREAVGTLIDDAYVAGRGLGPDSDVQAARTALLALLGMEVTD